MRSWRGASGVADGFPFCTQRPAKRNAPSRPQGLPGSLDRGVLTVRPAPLKRKGSGGLLMFGILRVIGGIDKGRMFTLVDGQSLVIGRETGAETDLRDPKLAPQHFLVRLAGNRVSIRD